MPYASAGPRRGFRLHVGCGPERLRGWINADLERHPGVDLILDARQPLPFADATMAYVFAEHFLEHLDRDNGVAFLSECRRVLHPRTGVIRVSTPNLDWVWSTHYRYPADAATKRAGAFHLNQAFHGWGHRYLYNDVVLTDALQEAGFEDVQFFRYGESDRNELGGLERHEINRFETSETLPHVVIAQAHA
ncbi:MAG TPA: methyltransferase domain-containing protein [Thermoanaerobaculia bacterium]|nr:methyltransferase domain-containing protein [Thermoanaerobaculia bacterium]